jgi:hypothetical protein
MAFSQQPIDRQPVGNPLLRCGGGLYTARAQENLRATPPREGGVIAIEAIGIAFVIKKRRCASTKLQKIARFGDVLSSFTRSAGIT